MAWRRGWRWLAALVLVGAVCVSSHPVTPGGLMQFMDWAGKAEYEQITRSQQPFLGGAGYLPPSAPDASFAHSLPMAQRYHTPPTPAGRPMQEHGRAMPRFLQTLLPPQQPAVDATSERWLPRPTRQQTTIALPTNAAPASALPRFQSVQQQQQQQQRQRQQATAPPSIAASGPPDDGANYFYPVAQPEYLASHYPTAGTLGVKPRDLQTPVAFLEEQIQHRTRGRTHTLKECDDLRGLLKKYHQSNTTTAKDTATHLQKALDECQGKTSRLLPPNKHNTTALDCAAIEHAIAGAGTNSNAQNVSSNHRTKWRAIQSHLKAAHDACRGASAKSVAAAKEASNTQQPGLSATCAKYQRGYLLQDATLSQLKRYSSKTAELSRRRKNWYRQWVQCRRSEQTRTRGLQRCARLEVKYKRGAVRVHKLRSKINQLARSGVGKKRLQRARDKLGRVEGRRYAAYSMWLACVKKQKPKRDCSEPRTQYQQWRAKYHQSALADGSHQRATVKAEHLRHMNHKLWRMCSRHKAAEETHVRCNRLHQVYRSAQGRVRALRSSMTAKKKGLETDQIRVQELTTKLGALVKQQSRAYQQWTECQLRKAAKNKEINNSDKTSFLQRAVVARPSRSRRSSANPQNRLPQTANDAGGPDPAAGAQSDSDSDSTPEPEWIIPPLPEGFQNRLGPSQSISLGPGTVVDQAARKEDPVTGRLYPHEDQRPAAGNLPDHKANVDQALQSAASATQAQGVTAQGRY